MAIFLLTGLLTSTIAVVMMSVAVELTAVAKLFEGWMIGTGLGQSLRRAPTTGRCGARRAS